MFRNPELTDRQIVRPPPPREHLAGGIRYVFYAEAGAAPVKETPPQR